MMIYVILSAAAIVALSAYVAYMRVMVLHTLDIHNATFEKYDTRFASISSNTVKELAALRDRIASVEDFEAMIKDQLGGEQHSDYWTSVMNYNPYIKKEDGK